MRVLVVDDNSDAAEMLADLLRETGFELAIALDGTTALSTFITFQPHVAVLDIGLPDRDGFKLASLVRADSRMRSTVLIAYSAHPQTSCIEAGFDHYLVKPNALEQLLVLLDDYRSQLG